MATFQENLDSTAPASSISEHAIELAMAGVRFFLTGQNEGNPLHEGLYQLRYGTHKACDRMWLQCSEYLLDVEYGIQADMEHGEFWDIVFPLAEQLEKIPSDQWEAA